MERREQTYSGDNLIAAINEVKKGSSIRSVAIKYNISRATLQRRLKVGVALATQKGPTPIFNREQESNISFWITSMANAGFPISKETLMHSVAKLAKELKISFPGGNELSGRKWYESFMKRHPNIKMRTSQNLTTSRQHVTQDRINSWFEEVDNYIKTNNLQDVLVNPRRIFNCDETAFFLNPKLKKVLAAKGSKNVYTTTGADEKLNLTVLLTGNAAGELAPPMVIYRYDRIPQRVAEAMPPNWAIGKSQNGWMTQETFYEYITNIFEPYLRKEEIPTPVILFMDGHCSHLSLHLSTFCMAHGIELVALPPNATHLLQPMDVAVFHALKSIWRQEVMNFRVSNEGRQIQKHDFPGVLKTALDHLSSDTICNGFRACGIFPWNPKKVVVSKEIKPQNSAPPIKREEDSFLRILEEKIGETKLKMFLENEGEWNGPVEQTDLYYLWLEAKSSSNLQPSSELNIEITEEENDLNVQETVEVFRDSAESLNVNSISDLISDQVMVNEQTIEIVKENTVIQESVGFFNEENTDIQESVDLYNEENTDIQESVGLCNEVENNDHAIAGLSKNIPSPFKRALFWPQREGDKRKKRKHEKLPAVVTSPQMIMYYKKKEDEKNAKIAEKEKLKEKEGKLKRNRKKLTIEKEPENLQRSLQFHLMILLGMN